MSHKMSRILIGCRGIHLRALLVDGLGPIAEWEVQVLLVLGYWWNGAPLFWILIDC